MKLAWQDLNLELQELREINLENFSERKRANARWQLMPLAIGQIAQLFIGIWMSLQFGSHWIEHFPTPHLLVSGLLCHAFGIMLVVFAARELYMIFHIDFSESVVSIQKKLTMLQTWRSRVGSVIVVTSCFIWMPMLLFLFSWVGVNVLVNDPNSIYWVIANIIVSVILMAVYVTWNRIAKSNGNFPPSDKPIAQAQEELREIKAFKQQAE